MKKALWMTAFPDQAHKAAGIVKKVNRRIRARSKRMEERMKEYRRLKAEFLSANPFCAVLGKPTKATDIHHTRGRAGKLLLDTRFWIAVSRAGHDWIHSNIELARDFGFICAKGDWNKQPKENECPQSSKQPPQTALEVKPPSSLTEESGV